ncbi:hypothetical protein K435DRAFT_694663, partial [Dendrothele bispora CBS 962.96]
PSEASGVSLSSYEEQTAAANVPDSEIEVPGVLWLLEPYHTTQTTKYSGTLQELHKNTLPFKTMTAFAHYSLYWTNGKKVFVDLQCM